MKVFLLSVLIVIVLSGPALVRDPSAPLFTQEDIDKINQSQDSWTASLDWVGSMTVGQAKRYALNQIKPRQLSEYNWEVLPESYQASDNFDGRVKWPNCIHPIRDQLNCGSDWAFAATEVLSDRFCIASGGKTNVVLSPQYLVDCDYTDFGCEWGYQDHTWQFLVKTGVPTEKCVSYTGAEGNCPTTCGDGSALQFYKAAAYTEFKSLAQIQQDLSKNGPLETGFDVYEDFMAYSSGIYKHTTGGFLGGHYVKIVGWGNQNGTNYWICANSWGTSWGSMKGYFYIAFGQCNIDNDVIAGPVNAKSL